MKRSILLFIPLLAACSSIDSGYEPLDPQLCVQAVTRTPEPAPDPLDVNSYELARVINVSLSDCHFPRSRSQESYTIDTITDTNGNAAMYAVNFENNGGFILVSAVKTTAPLLAYNTSGHFSMDGNDSPLSYWCSELVKGIEKSRNNISVASDAGLSIWFPFENYGENCLLSRAAPEDGSDFNSWPEELKEKYRKSVAVLADTVGKWGSGAQVYWLDDEKKIVQLFGQKIYNDACESCKAAVYYQFETNWRPLSVMVVRPRTIQETLIPNFIKTQWNQNGNFNISYPAVGNLTHAYAGCVPVAMGQIMRYHEWPSTYNWADMPYYFGNKTVSDLLYYIAEQGNANYTENGTSMGNQNANSTFIKMGYSTTGVNKLSALSEIKSHLAGKKPVYLSGEDSRGSSAHAWVACGYSYGLYESILEIYTVNQPQQVTCCNRIFLNSTQAESAYMNWGWGGVGDGFYHYGIFSPSGYNFSVNPLYILPTPNK